MAPLSKLERRLRRVRKTFTQIAEEARQTKFDKFLSTAKDQDNSSVVYRSGLPTLSEEFFNSLIDLIIQGRDSGNTARETALFALFDRWGGREVTGFSPEQLVAEKLKRRTESAGGSLAPGTRRGPTSDTKGSDADCKEELRKVRSDIEASTSKLAIGLKATVKTIEDKLDRQHEERKKETIDLKTLFRMGRLK